MNAQQPFDFQCDVIEQSHDIPVLVDFWAEICAPCHMLTPVLEKLATESNGRWKLVKVNTDEYPDIAVRYHVSGIPVVKLFIKGEVVSEFSGAIPERSIRAWLKKELPGLYEKEIKLAAEFVFQGKPAMAVSLLEGVLHKEPDNLHAHSILARLRLFSHPDEALRMCASLENEPEYQDLVDTVRVLARLVTLSEDKLPLDTARDIYLSAIDELKKQHFDAALSLFIDVLMQNRNYDDDGSRHACIAIFRYLGEEHEISKKYRKLFDRSF
jgi:putative thioredoxin